MIYRKLGHVKKDPPAGTEPAQGKNVTTKALMHFLSVNVCYSGRVRSKHRLFISDFSICTAVKWQKFIRYENKKDNFY